MSIEAENYNEFANVDDGSCIIFGCTNQISFNYNANATEDDESCLNAISVDHLLKVSDKSIQKLSNSDTVATLLPGTGYFLGKNQADARKLLDAGVKVSIASDYNPGSCHFNNVFTCFLAPIFSNFPPV